ncbi:maleylpyruvate isomerase family mycothiol-dependent enzyme [Nocardia sp. NPDC005998]|uniref:maleylpyruvate isomerase family mycothiol-dependent enzyme n=1 Tax=Nocardia sp. NPDC005998 TaxID=3156894 RepID=UPI0033BD87FB
MSHAGIIGMRSSGDDILTVSSGLTEDEWQTPSAAAGWTVHDVVIHAGALLELLQAAVGGEAAPDLGIEAINDAVVAQRRDWDPARTVDNLNKQLAQALPVFSALQEEPMASMQTPMVDLGTYPLHAIADMFTFDMSTHLRYDILAPRGPIAREMPPLDDVRLTPSVSWLLGGIPKMQPTLAGHLSAPLALRLTGPAAREVLISPDADAITVRPLDSAADNAAAMLTSTSEDFLAWSTTRLPWRRLVSIEGDRKVAAEFLGALNLI